MTTFNEALAQLRGAEGHGFGISEAQGASILNEGIRRFASRAKNIRARVSFGPTVAGTADYAVPTNVVDLESLRVGTTKYQRTDFDSLIDFQNGDDYLPGSVDGVFAGAFDETGAAKSIELFPTPDTLSAGQTLKALAAIYPATALSGSDPLPFPEDHWQGALWAAVAICYERVDENTPQADVFWGRFRDDAEELRRLANSRIGSGPTAIGGPWRR